MITTGIPQQFSFECAFRARRPPVTPWYLFHVTNHYEESQLSVTLNPSKYTLGLELPDVDGNLQQVLFRHQTLFDRLWHKVMLGVTESQATLWVDCKPVQGVRGEYAEPFQPRGYFDATGGHLYVSKMVQTAESVPVGLILLLLDVFLTQCLIAHCCLSFKP